MPFPLFLSAEFLYENVSSHESFHLRLQELADVLRELKNVNNLEQSYMDLLPRSCISKSAKLLTHSAQVSDPVNYHLTSVTSDSIILPT